MTLFNNKKTFDSLMRKSLRNSVAALVLLSSSMLFAGEASTSATAGSNGGRRPGTAGATASYVGEGPGLARTTTRSGNVNYGRGVAFGVDDDGVSFSVSQALAGRVGPAIASTFNISLGFDGQVSASNGWSVADHSRTRTVNAGGFARSDRGNTISGATAGGSTGRFGTVKAKTESHSTPRQMNWRSR